MPPVCKFWQQGTCRNGDRCRFEHPSDRNAQSNNRFAALDHYSPNDRNGGFQSGGRSNQSSSYGGAASSLRTRPYNLDKDQIIADLTTERPQWILSAYGPGRQAPAQLFGGALREQSFEEMRLLHYMGLASGSPQQVVQEADGLVQASEQQIQTALNDVEGAINFIINAENDHPNRIDVVRESQTSTLGDSPASTVFGQSSGKSSNPFGVPSQPTSTNPFGAPSQPTISAFGAPSTTAATAGAFGQPSAIGQKLNPFGAPSQPAFGAPSQLGSSGAFGQPSALGQNSKSFGAPSGLTTGAFGQSSTLGQQPNPFGAPSGPAGGGAFGQPSALGQKPNPFGAPSVGAFGQPSALGQKPNPFGAPSGPTAGVSTTAAPPFSSFAGATSTFGQPSQTTSSNPFGTPLQPSATSQPSTNVFGQPSQPTQVNSFLQTSQITQPSAFGQPSVSAPNTFSSPAQPQANPGPFSTPASSAPFGALSQPAPTNPFGISSQPTTSPFGAPSTTTTTGGFGQLSVAAAPQNPFGSPTSRTDPLTSGPSANPFGDPSQNPPPQTATNGVTARPYDPNATYQHPPLESYSSNDGSGRLAMFKGKRLTYKDGQVGTIARDGSWEKIWFPAGPPPYYKDTELEDSAYNDATKKVYMHMRETGKFEGGIMPMIPPKREWCLWDF